MDVQITASLLGGLVSGLFTFLGVFLTIAYQRKKDKAEEKRLQEQRAQEEFTNRPRLEIVEYKDITPYKEETDVNIGMLVCSIRDFKNSGRALFYYDKEISNPEEWVFAEYMLKNIGNTEISQVYFVSNLPKDTSIFNTTKAENVMCYDHHLYSRRVRLDAYIKPDQIIRIRVYFVSNKIVYSSFGNPLISLWVVDEFGKMWYQDLDAPNNSISDARLTDKTLFCNYTDERVAIECFIDPLKW